MRITNKKRFIVFCSLVALIAIGFFGALGYFFWNLSRDSFTLEKDLKNYAKSGEEVVKDLKTLPAMQIEKQTDKYVLTDNTSDGIDIKYNKAGENQLSENKETEKPKFQIDFPTDYQKPIEVKLDKERTITITDNSKDKAIPKLLSSQETTNNDEIAKEKKQTNDLLALTKESPKSYLSYETNRKKIIYAYQKDQASGEKKLKNWIVYANGTGQEQESYTLKNAKIKKNDQGQIEVFYFGEKELASQQAANEVEPSLLERAQKTLQQEMGQDILNSGSPDFLIPKPYFLDKDGTKTELDWSLNVETNTITLEIKIKNPRLYPIALDPTLSFTAPGQSNSGSVMTGEAESDYFGYSMTAGDFNADGKTDLAVGATGASSAVGRAYIFYNSSIKNENASGADVIITGETGSYFGWSMTAGDFNADGKTDLAVGANLYSTFVGRAYIFYNDGSIPTTAATADVIITGEASSSFGNSMTGRDFNADGKTDLAVGAWTYSSYTGRAYIFYNGSITTENATGADIIITGETSSRFGNSMTAGDFNADGKNDLAVGAYFYSSEAGRAYIFYNGSIITENATGADVIITGEASSYFGNSMTAGDFNADGKTDLAVGAYDYDVGSNTNEGRAYIFYNGSIITESVTGADVIIIGETDSYFGSSMTTGDFNADGKTDLAVGATGASGRAYIFYNDGSISTTAATADVIITGETDSYLGESMTAADFNADGKTDLAVGANIYSSQAGRAYIFYSQNGQVNTNFKITGEASSKLGYSMMAGDFNADGKTDLAVGATGYSSSAGRAYIFYSDGSIPTTAATADVIITGETGSLFGTSMTAGDFNADGKIDLAVGSWFFSVGSSTYEGRAYVFYNGSIITENATGADAIITGETGTGGNFGWSMTAGDFNADGKTDLAVGAYYYSSSAGRAYIFYNGSITTENATGADVIITGETSSSFGQSMTAGDFNADGKTDLAVGAMDYSSLNGRAYIFYNGSITTENATGADVIITGESESMLGHSMTAGDFNADGKTDLAIVAIGYSLSAGRAYIFYNGSITTENATGADVIITGEADSFFGKSMTVGDFNADGKIDLAVGANGYSSWAGRAYIFYNGAIITENATGADVIISGETSSQFGVSMTSGDFNSDGKTDLAVGAYTYSSNAGQVYIYETRDNYAWQLQPQKTIRTSPISGQEMTITGESSSYFGSSMTVGDFNNDGKNDLVVGAWAYSSYAGRAYIFYNDGTIPSAAYSGADVIITGETSSEFGASMTAGDFNADGKTDLAIGGRAYDDGSYDFKGRAYIFYNGSIKTKNASAADVIITGIGGSNNRYFGKSMISGDFNADGKTDLAVGEMPAYVITSDGCVFIFYNGTTTKNASTADAIITGETGTGGNFGWSMTAGDFNADGKTDLAVGAPFYYPGRTYVFYNGSIVTKNASAADAIITGETGFGKSMTAGDFNADGKTDLAVGDSGYSSAIGRAYIFYSGSIITENATGADVIITGETGSYFGVSMTAGDFNTDGKTDLIVGSFSGYAIIGRAYIFYNDGTIPTTAVTADLIIIGEGTTDFSSSMTTSDFNADGKTDLAVGAMYYSSSAGRVYLYTFNDPVATGETSSYLGASMTAGDFNADGKTDLAVGATGASSNAGRAYVFYNDGSIPTTAATADIIITGEANSYFGVSTTAGDFNADGKTDLAVGATGYSSYAGRAYVFYNGTTTKNASAADVIITGESSSMLGKSMTSGDFNADGKTDLAVGAYGYDVGSYTSEGRAYIFYNGSIITENATGADVIITGEASNNYFGASMTTGDFNADGKTDLAVGGSIYSSFAGRAYIFYNGSIITKNASGADVIITGNAGNFFGSSMTAGDFNADGKTDLAVGADAYSSSAGRAYIFYNGSITTKNASAANVIITGEASSGFGWSITAGDFNTDGKTDLAIGANDYDIGSATNEGRAYIFYNGTRTKNASAADIIYTGEASSKLGYSMMAGDFNADGKTDLAVGANGYSSSAGKFYVYTTESKVGDQVMSKISGTIKASGTVKFQ